MFLDIDNVYVTLKTFWELLKLLNQMEKKKHKEQTQIHLLVWDYYISKGALV